MQKTRKWTLAALVYILDMARINTQTVFSMHSNVSNTNSSDFSLDIVKALPTPHMESCKFIYQN